MQHQRFLLIVFFTVVGIQTLWVNKVWSMDNAKENGTVFYTCPMHPEIHQSNPGDCLKCGMKLIKEVSKAENNDTILQSIDPQRKISHVCMMNNKYFESEQIPADVEGKIYYGCCQGCVASLKNNRSMRYAKDPHNGEEVDKANSYIVLNQDGSKNVLYFKSDENYSKYLIKK